MIRNRTPAVRRRIAGMPHAPRAGNLPWDTRKTGSAAIECAFVAAGLLRVACFDHPNIWDVAGGVCLVRAAGGDVLMKADSGWAPLQLFEPPINATGASDLRHWRRPIIVGDREAAAQLCEITAA